MAFFFATTQLQRTRGVWRAFKVEDVNSRRRLKMEMKWVDSPFVCG